MTTASAKAERKERMVAWILGQGIQALPLHEIKARLATQVPAVLPGPVPDEATLHRWLVAHRPRQRGRGAPRELAAPQTEVAGTLSPDAATALAALPASPGASASREDLAEHVERLWERIIELRDALQQRGWVNEELEAKLREEQTWMRKLQRAEERRRSRGVLRGLWKLEGLRVREEQLNKLAGVLTRRLVQGPPRAIASASDTPENSLPQTASSACALVSKERRLSVMPFAEDASKPALSATDRDQAWGQAIDAQPRLPVGSVVERAHMSRTRRDALTRWTLLMPVLSGQMTSREAAELWRRHFHGQTTQEERLLLPDIPDEDWLSAVERYLDLHEDTLASWLRRVRKAQECGPKEKTIDVASILEHRQPHKMRESRKLSLEIRREIKEQFLGVQRSTNGEAATLERVTVSNASAVIINQWLKDHHGVVVSDRTVQRLIARTIGDHERVLSRGGIAAADLFRTRMIRQATRPNQVWIMDHSFFKAEKRDPQHPEWWRNATDIDFPCEFAVAQHSIGSQPTRRRVEKMSMTLIIDACTRRRLVLRVWSGTPSTMDTLAALRDAIEQYGVPEMLYTDNGGDFTSRRFQSVLAAVGIRHVKSVPYCPQGRGAIERDFRTIKEKVLPTMAGYYKDESTVRVADELLLEHAEFEQRLWARVDRLLNHVRHEETGRIPAEHYDQAVTARVLLTPGLQAASIALLSIREDVRRSADGLYLLGGRYAGPGLIGIPEGANVTVYVDPGRPTVGHVAVRDREGAMRLNGIVERYGQGGADAPQFDVQQQMEAEWIAERDQHLARAREAASLGRANEEARAEGEALADDIATEIRSALEVLTSQETAMPNLPPGPPVAVQWPSSASEVQPAARRTDKEDRVGDGPQRELERAAQMQHDAMEGGENDDEDVVETPASSKPTGPTEATASDKRVTIRPRVQKRAIVMPWDA